ncbi:HNH endonuclease [Vandammella animalimorsus]|uniref:HNH endonuclease n=1 Tax=Vandammella animalimorsus TaxID=2029117 RepID=UPI001EED6CAD|nr:HNH endonuclease [Vandammella animalimorsus]
MNIAIHPPQRSLIEGIGHDNGFEHVSSSTAEGVRLDSARHRNQVLVMAQSGGGYGVRFEPAMPSLLPELRRSFPAWASDAAAEFDLPTQADMALLLRRAAQLSQALPNQAMHEYQTAVAEAVAALPDASRGTEVERLLRQRLGQDYYRKALLDYWGSACAVTGVALPQVLRASHAKPWAECVNDAERLDVFNGLLLTANLDALFDRFLISFDDHGHLLSSARVSQADLQKLGIHPYMRLRWLASEHRPYLCWHRQCFLRAA